VNTTNGTAPGPDEIHVWSFALDRTPEEVARVAGVLSCGERARAAAFHFPRDRSRFEVARTRLRELLAGYVGCGAAELRFTHGAHGKPALEYPAQPELRFNLSHSHGHALLAVAHGCEVGVDLEQVRPDVDFDGIVASHFSPTEQAAWTGLPEEERSGAFFHGWVRKEAYVKARGEGLMRDGARYSVSVEPAARVALLEDTMDPGAPAAWSIDAVAAPAGYAAAVAYSGTRRRVVVRETR
jgi:4'-phosphopantetheinyl transferase